MMKQLLKQIYNERRSNAFLWIELLLVFVVLWYIIDLVYVTLHIYYQPMGFNIENTYVLRMNRLTDKSTDFNPELTVKDDMTALREIAGRLSRHPEVESVCISQNSIPYNEGCSGASFRFPDNDTVWISTMDRWTTPEYYKVFRFRNIDGSGHESLVKALEKNTIIVPVDVADYYPDATFHGKDLLGKEVRMSDTNFRIAALTEPVRYDRYNIAGKPFTGTYIGTFWFRTQQRRGEVALRMAMGANRKNIFYRLITEGLLLLSMSALPAVLIAFNIGYTELVDISQMAFTVPRFLIAILLTYLLMAIMIILGVLYPALQSMKVQPAEALRDE